MSATSRTKSSSFLSYWKEHKIKKMGTDIAYALFTNSVLHYLCHTFIRTALVLLSIFKYTDFL